jgi:hypothetical protein
MAVNGLKYFFIGSAVFILIGLFVAGLFGWTVIFKGVK